MYRSRTIPSDSSTVICKEINKDIFEEYKAKCVTLVDELEKNGWFAGTYNFTYFINTGNPGSLSKIAPDLLLDSLFTEEEQRDNQLIELICEYFISPEALSPAPQDQKKRKLFLSNLHKGETHLAGFTMKFQKNLAREMCKKLNTLNSTSQRVASILDQQERSIHELQSNLKSFSASQAKAMDEKFEKFKRYYLDEFKCNLFSNPYSQMKLALPSLTSIEEVRKFSNDHPNSKRTARILKKIDL